MTSARTPCQSSPSLTGRCPADAARPGGETAGLRRLGGWARQHLAGYDRDRDDLAADATSRLSPYLHLGCVSPLAVTAQLDSMPGSAPFLRQLAWRDFFSQLLAARPDAAYRDYRDRGDRWHDDPDSLAAWQAGMTGYPVVDAAMRQLAREGFMHNRARMIVASFLTKDLRIDWRAGASHFMTLLADADVACNQLNWQWVAGTGTDTQRHRIFNPTLQGRRFDPRGEYIRRYLPELDELSAEQVHDPAPQIRAARGYPRRSSTTRGRRCLAHPWRAPSRSPAACVSCIVARACPGGRPRTAELSVHDEGRPAGRPFFIFNGSRDRRSREHRRRRP